MSEMELIQDWVLGLIRIPEPQMFNLCCLTDVLIDQAAEIFNYPSNYKNVIRIS